MRESFHASRYTAPQNRMTLADGGACKSFYRASENVLTVVLASLLATSRFSGVASADEPPRLDYQIELTTPRRGYDGKMCWVHTRAGAIPAGSGGYSGKLPIVVMTTQKLLVTGSDVFYG